MSTALGLLSFQKAIKGGVRPNLFQVNHSFPTGVATPAITEVQGGEVAYMCKAAALPATNIGTVELPFRGRVIKVPGDRTYETWTATFYMDDAFELRSAYEKWIELTNGVDTNTATADVSTAGMLENITVEQLNKFGGTATDLEVIRKYELFQGFPVSVSQVSVAYDNNDSFEEFDVEFAYQYHTSTGGNNEVK
tara:strand:+ start:217 stop:798 length:582 start_codon:yes stop_codon:yes gene_type:complete